MATKPTSVLTRAREHRKSGLRMIYGQSDSGTTPAAGELIGSDQDLEAAICRVGEKIEAPAQLAADCIASIGP